jgi:hypothetical protein
MREKVRAPLARSLVPELCLYVCPPSSIDTQDLLMQDEIVFIPDRRGVRVQHVALISGGFFVFVQLLFLDGLQSRIAFTVAFVVFLLLGFLIIVRYSRNWPQKIVINHLGIGYDDLEARHGVDLIPWNEIVRIDLYYSNDRLPPHLRIGLRPGIFNKQLKKNRLQRLSMGLDVNIPVSVNVEAKVVLQTAQQFWKDSGFSRD